MNMIIALLFTLSALLSGCSSDKKKSTPVVVTSEIPPPLPPLTVDQSEVQEEALGIGDVLLTFSVENALKTYYPHFRLGIYEMVATIEIEDGNRIDVALFDRLEVSDTDNLQSLPVELTHLEPSMHLFTRLWPLPEGRLVGLKVVISAAQSGVAVEDEYPVLVDAFNAAFGGDNAELTARFFPVEVTIDVDNIEIKKNTRQVIDLSLDQNISVGFEPYPADDVSHSLFVPTFHARSLTEPFTLVIRQSDIVSVRDDVLALGYADDETGDTSVFTVPLALSDGPMLSVDGEPVEALENMTGTYLLDLTGTYSITASGDIYTLDQAFLFRMEASSDAVVYEGEIMIDDEEKVHARGVRQSLDIGDEASVYSSFFSGPIGDHQDVPDLVDGDHALVLADEDGLRLVDQVAPEDPDASGSTFFVLKAPTPVIPEDLLNIQSIERTDDSATILLADRLSCQDVLKYSTTADEEAVCEGEVVSVVFPFHETGNFMIHRTRNGAVDIQDEGDATVELEPDEVLTFEKMTDFLGYLETAIVQDGDRLSTIMVEGEFEGEAFLAGSKVSVVLFASQSAIDAETDGGGLQEEGARQGITSDTELYIGAGVSVAAAAALGAVIVYGARKFIQSRRVTASLGLKIVNDDGVIEILENGESRLFHLGSNALYEGDNYTHNVKVTYDDKGGIAAYQYPVAEEDLSENERQKLDLEGNPLPADSQGETVISANGRTTLQTLTEVELKKGFRLVDNAGAGLEINVELFHDYGTLRIAGGRRATGDRLVVGSDINFHYDRKVITRNPLTEEYRLPAFQFAGDNPVQWPDPVKLTVINGEIQQVEVEGYLVDVYEDRVGGGAPRKVESRDLGQKFILQDTGESRYDAVRTVDNPQQRLTAAYQANVEQARKLTKYQPTLQKKSGVYSISTGDDEGYQLRYVRFDDPSTGDRLQYDLSSRVVSLIEQPDGLFLKGGIFGKKIRLATIDPESGDIDEEVTGLEVEAEHTSRPGQGEDVTDTLLDRMAESSLSQYEAVDLLRTDLERGLPQKPFKAGTMSAELDARYTDSARRGSVDSTAANQSWFQRLTDPVKKIFRRHKGSKRK